MGLPLPLLGAVRWCRGNNSNQQRSTPTQTRVLVTCTPHVLPPGGAQAQVHTLEALSFIYEQWYGVIKNTPIG